MASSEFSISVHDLDAGGKHLRFPIRAAWLRGALEGADVAPAGGDGQLDVRVSRSGRDVVVRGRVTAELNVPCARCLDPARISIGEDISALAVEGDVDPAIADEEAEAGADDADLLHHDGDTLVLDDLVRDELLLAIPMIPLCSQSCPGIRPEPVETSVSSEVDPRMRPLLRLKKP
jgi:uncharacterized protein